MPQLVRNGQTSLSQTLTFVQSLLVCGQNRNFGRCGFSAILTRSSAIDGPLIPAIVDLLKCLSSPVKIQTDSKHFYPTDNESN